MLTTAASCGAGDRETEIALVAPRQKAERREVAAGWPVRRLRCRHCLSEHGENSLIIAPHSAFRSPQAFLSAAAAPVIQVMWRCEHGYRAAARGLDVVSQLSGSENRQAWPGLLV
jgi:hypothetical protein